MPRAPLRLRLLRRSLCSSPSRASPHLEHERASARLIDTVSQGQTTSTENQHHQTIQYLDRTDIHPTQLHPFPPPDDNDYPHHTVTLNRDADFAHDQSTNFSGTLTQSLQASSDSTALVAPLGWWPSDVALRFVDAIHQTGIPWWGAIVSGAIVGRLALLPLTVYGMQQGARMQQMKKPLAELQARLNSGEDQTKVVAEVQALYAKHGANPMGAIVPALAQMPVFLSFFIGLRRLADVRPDVSDGGALWFSDLGATDSTYVLPMTFSASALALLFVSMPRPPAMATAAEVQQHTLMRNMFIGITIVSLPVAMNMPTAVLLYWLTNNAFSLAWTTTTNCVPGVRTALGLPPSPLTTDSPGTFSQHSTQSQQHSTHSQKHSTQPRNGSKDSSGEEAVSTLKDKSEAEKRVTAETLSKLADNLAAAGKGEEAALMQRRAYNAWLEVAESEQRRLLDMEKQTDKGR